jgi:lipooligosaccharide transport system ATP-binding protein
VSDIIIEARSIAKKFAGKAVVDGVSFDVRKGQCFGLLGPNGAGKTTTFKMIYGSASLTSGELFVAGLSVKNHIAKIKSLIGVMPQENNLDPDFSVLDNLLIYADYHGLSRLQARDRAVELLTTLQLEDYAERPIDHLSGGMKRRLALARALITRPKILFLDEPTTGLDPQARMNLWDQIADLKKSGTTVFLTTHYMEEAEVLCDRILVMSKGRVVAEGSPKQLIEIHVGSEVVEFEVPPQEIEYYVSKVTGKFEYQVLRNRLKLFIRDAGKNKEAIDLVQKGIPQRCLY